MARAWSPQRLVCLSLVAVLLSLTSSVAHAADLFYNYYVSGNPPAQAFLSPRPTPPLVGHTYLTYQPLYPNEFLYRHHRTYKGYDGQHRLPVNRTTVSWKSGVLRGKVWRPKHYPEIMFQFAP
jgi:hypothetical protein